MRRILYFVIPVLILGGVIAWRVAQKKHEASAQAKTAKARKTAAPNVRVATAVMRDIVHEYQGVGDVESRSDVRIAAKVTGRVEYLQVREGNPVHRGDVLARLDPTEIRASINQQQANNASAQASLTNAQIRYNRTYDLYKQGFTAAQDVDDAKAAVAVARSTLNAGLAQLHNLQAQLADTVLRAPINGFVTARFLDPGSIVTAGQPIVTVQVLRNVYVTTSVPEEISGKIEVGASATAVFDAYPGRTFQGKITQVNTAADPQSRQFLIRASFSNETNLLKPGMFCRITMVTQVTHNAIVVPHEAIQKGPKGTRVTVIDDRKIAHLRIVRTGDEDVTGIAVLDGVKAGENVVTLTSQPVKDGQAVTIDTSPAQSPSTSGQSMVAGGGGGAPIQGASPVGGGANAPTYGVPSGSGGPAGGSAGPGSASGPASGSSVGGISSGGGAGGGSAASSGVPPSIGRQGGGSGNAASNSTAAPGMSGGGGGAAGSPSSGSVGAPAGGSVGAPSGGNVGAPSGGGAAGGSGR